MLEKIPTLAESTELQAQVRKIAIKYIQQYMHLDTVDPLDVRIAVLVKTNKAFQSHLWYVGSEGDVILYVIMYHDETDNETEVILYKPVAKYGEFE